jgi:hypothetical protein
MQPTYPQQYTQPSGYPIIGGSPQYLPQYPVAPAAGYPPQYPAAGYPPQYPAVGYSPQYPAAGYLL